MEGGKGVVVDMRDLFRWVGGGRESSSGQKGSGAEDLAVLEVLCPGPWGRRWWPGMSDRGGRHLNCNCQLGPDCNKAFSPASILDKSFLILIVDLK